MRTKPLLSAFLLAIVSAAPAAVPETATAPPACRRKVVDHVFWCSPTLMDMRALQTTIEAYAVDHSTYPMAKSMAELRALVEPIYIAKTPMADAWGTEFRYAVSSDGKDYRLVSAGSDRVFDESTWDVPGFLDSSKDDTVLRSVDGPASKREWAIQE
jgi:hypothetical protein